MNSTSSSTFYSSNTPFVKGPLSSCSDARNSGTLMSSGTVDMCKVAPFDMMGYQCSEGKGCGTVNQFTFQPTNALFYSAEQCGQVCGLSSSTYRPKSAFL
jgi:hypothetical protein